METTLPISKSGRLSSGLKNFGGLVRISNFVLLFVVHFVQSKAETIWETTKSKDIGSSSATPFPGRAAGPATILRHVEACVINEF